MLFLKFILLKDLFNKIRFINNLKMYLVPIAFCVNWYENLISNDKVMLTISEILLASAVFLGIVYLEVQFLYTKTNTAK